MKRDSRPGNWTRLTALRAIRAELATLPGGERFARHFDTATHSLRTGIARPLVEGFGNVSPRDLAVTFARMLELAEAELRGELTHAEGLAVIIAHARAHLARTGAD